MGDRPILAGRGVVAGQVAEIIVALDGEPGRRGSGYRVGPASVLTAAHVVEGAVAVRVRFDADLPGEWTAEVIPCWSDPRSDLAVLSIVPREGQSAVVVARFGRIGGDRAAVLAAWSVGFPRFKLKTDDGVEDPQRYRDSHQADGSVAVLSNRREGTLELTVSPPERDPDPGVSPWEGMSGAAVWVGDRIVGVIAKHHRRDGLGRLAAVRLDLALADLDPDRLADLRTLLGLPDVLPDVVPPSAGEWVRTAYQAQVRDIAPDRLLDRDAELDELVGFCTGDQPYAWWQAGPWAGKSALMSWFVLHPPAGVDVVSFFVTARLAGQSDSDACTDALIEQLAALLGESPATLLTAGARRGTLLRLLEDAANQSREAGRRLLLVIDGLDEDSGNTTGPSIAALLPHRPPPEVRVLVASRPDPPIPDDVDSDHPLRRISPRQLDVSGQARSVERRAKHELTQLLTGSQLQRDVLGFITASGGGLTLGDLEQLTQRPPFEIEPLLGGVFGRTVGSRIAMLSAKYPDERMYLFTHETLRLVAEQQYGASLTTYRDHLHTWADTYRQRGWPADTPHYLLRGYSRMLASSGDLPRLVACATDQVRRDRIRNRSGGDALGFTEISITQQGILAQPDPDLTSLALLRVQQDHLTNRYSFFPDELPAGWARIGQLTRAEALVSSITDWAKRTRAWCSLVKVVAASGEHDQAARLADEAEAFIAQQTEPIARAPCLAELAEAVAAGGDSARAARLVGEAEALAGQTTYPGVPTWKLAPLAAAVVDGSGSEWAARLADEAEARVEQIIDPYQRVGMLARLVELVAVAGDRDRISRLAGEAQALIRQITEPYWQESMLVELVAAVAAGGDYEWAEALAGQITTPYSRAQALTKLATVVTSGSDRDRVARLVAEAEAFAGQIIAQSSPVADQPVPVSALAMLVEVAAVCGYPDRADWWVDEALALIGQITEPYQQESALRTLVAAVTAGGDYQRAEELIGQISNPVPRGWALTRLAAAVAERGDCDRAARLLVEAETPADRITILDMFMLAHLVTALAVGGDRDRAALMAGEVAALIGRATDPGSREFALTELVPAMAAVGDYQRAEALVWHITDPDWRRWTLTRLVELVAAGGDRARAARLGGGAEALIGQITDQYQRAEALARLAEAVAAGGNRGRAFRLTGEAHALIGQITDPDQRSEALAALVAAVAVGGDYQRAEALARQITDPNHRVSALARLAEVVAAGGDRDHAVRLVDEAEALIGQIIESGGSMWVLVRIRLVTAMAVGGDYERAEALARQTEALAGQITDLRERAEAMAQLAGKLVETSKKAASIPGQERSGSPLMVRARHLLAEALVTGSWSSHPGVVVTGSWGEFVVSLARVDPLAVTALADEAQARWGLNAPAVLGAVSRDAVPHSAGEPGNNDQMRPVFISYVREDAESIDRLVRDLNDCGTKVWLDQNEIKPGARWAKAIRDAIQDGSFFLACFSASYALKERSYMNEELNLAVDELRKRRFGQAWFIPVLLDGGEIPDISIGFGETLRSLQWVDLRNDWDAGIRKILSTVSPGKK